MVNEVYSFSFSPLLSSGIELTFFSGVYGACISHNLHFGDMRNGLLGISGIFIGIGEIVGKINQKWFAGNFWYFMGIEEIVGMVKE